MLNVGQGFGKRMGVVWELLLEEGRECLSTVMVGWMIYEGYESGVKCGMWDGLASGVGGVRYIFWNRVMNVFAWLWVRLGGCFSGGVKQCTILEGWFIISKV